MDGGQCATPYAACFGTTTTCADGVQACCDLASCLLDCKAAHDPVLDPQGYFDCVCSNDQMGATSKCLDPAMQTDMATCQGKAGAEAIGLLDDIDSCVLEVCPMSCGG